MSLPRVDVRIQIKKSLQVIRLNAPTFKPANVTRMSRRSPEQSFDWFMKSTVGAGLLANASFQLTSSLLTHRIREQARFKFSFFITRK